VIAYNMLILQVRYRCDMESNMLMLSSGGDDVVDDRLLTDLPHADKYHGISSRTRPFLSC
jgi:hypothetical protein